MSISRRKFVKNIGTTVMVAPFLSLPDFPVKNNIEDKLNVHIFSKHLQFLNWKEASKAAKEIGFNGLDLTVRPKGHILPENVKKDLPKAIKQMNKAGLSCEMITTAIGDASNHLDKMVIQTAGAEGVKFYRSNWFKFKKDRSLEASLEHYKEKVRELGELNSENKIIGCYQNHSGTKVGASFWEVKEILKSVNPAFFGAQYDIRHAVAEGGNSWSNGVKLLKDHIKTIVLKDFVWGQVDGKWKIINVPIGQGMVDFDAYFKLMKKLDLKPPVSLHLEYSLGGAEKGKKDILVSQDVVFEAMHKDLNMVQKLWQNA